MVKEGLSLRLQEARQKCNLSIRDVAEKLNVSQQAVSQWEKGKSFPDVGNLVKLSDLYGLSIDKMLKGEKIEVTVETVVGEKEEEIKALAESVEEDKGSVIQKEAKDRTFQEILSILLILVLSCHIVAIGICVPIAIAVWMQKTERKYKWVYVVCMLAFVIGIYNTCIVCDYLFDWGISTIEKISSL